MVLELDFLAELQNLFGPEFRELIEKYARDSETTLVASAAALNQQDAERLARLAHALKGAAANLGAPGMADLCTALGEAARNRDWPRCAELLSLARADFAVHLPELRRLAEE